MYNICSIIQFILAQNEKQKSETYVGICVLALLSCIFIVDMFAKQKWAKEKALKQIYMLFAFVSIFVFIILWFYLRKNQ